MKNTLFFALLTTICFSCKSQILPVENVIHYVSQEQGIPENTTYVKDVNNLFDEFLGVWTTQYNGKTYQFQINKFTDTTYKGTLNDILLMRYKITDSNFQVIENTFHFANEDLRVIQGRYLLDDGESYLLTYLGPNTKCGQFGEVTIKINNNSLGGTQMSFEFNRGHDTIIASECPDAVTFPFPIDTSLTLTKQ